MDIVVRSAVAFVFIFLLLRLIGRRELSTLEPFDLILLVVMGDLIQQGVTQSDMSMTGAVLAVGTFAGLTVFASFLVYRFRRLRPVLDAKPLIIVEEGRLVERNVRHERMTEEEILAAARQQQITSLDEIRWAVLEGSGKISFITKG
jgi:uncharacterized membrane protein YcaP (DUF421 family)